jgi:predicted Zn-dependent peptidase
MRASFVPSRRSAAFTISGSVDTRSTAPALKDLTTVLTTALAGGLQPDELVAARDYLVGVSPMRWETPAAVAAQVIALVGNDLPLGYTDEFLDGMRTATLPELDAALRREVRPDDLIIVAVGEADAVVGPLRHLGFGEPVEVSA